MSLSTLSPLINEYDNSNFQILSISNTIITLLFILCLIIIYYFSRNRREKYDAKLIEEKIKIEMMNEILKKELKQELRDELRDKLKNKLKQELKEELEGIIRNFIAEQNIKMHLTKEKMVDNYTDIQIMQDKLSANVAEIKNKTGEEISALKNKQCEMDLKMEEYINIETLFDIIQKIKYDILKQHENLNLLSCDVRNIFKKTNMQELISNDILKQLEKNNSFLNNYSITTITGYMIKLDGSIPIPMSHLCGCGIGTNDLKLLFSIRIHLNIKYDDTWNRIKISHHLNDITSRNLFIEIKIIPCNYITHNYYNCAYNHTIPCFLNNCNISSMSYSIPVYMLCILMGVKIITFDDEDVTDLFENNFNNVKRYHEFMSLSNSVSKAKLCEIENVRKMFE